MVGSKEMDEMLADVVKQYPSSSAIAKMVDDERLVTALDDFYDSTGEADKAYKYHGFQEVAQKAETWYRHKYPGHALVALGPEDDDSLAC